MSWIAMTDRTEAAFNIRGLGVPRNAPLARGPMAPHEVLPRGTLVVEFRANTFVGRPQTLLTFRWDDEWEREMRIRLGANGRLTLSMRQGRASSEAALDMPLPGRDARIRMSYAWAAPQRAARLTAEMLDDGQIYQAEAYDPLPLPAADAKDIMRNGQATAISKDVALVAISDEIEPIGLCGGITQGTPVETSDGPVAVENLRLGDMVETATAGPQPIRWIGRRTVPALGGFRPMRLNAPRFGLRRDLTLAPSHRVRLGAADAIVHPEDEVLLPVDQLAEARRTLHERPDKIVTYYQVLLDVHDCLFHDGLWAESLFVGSIAHHPDLARSTVLANMPLSAIPVHRPFTRKRLTRFETQTHMTALAAG